MTRQERPAIAAALGSRDSLSKRVAAPSVAFRADASSRIGTGHVFRCLGIADEIRNRGGRTLFVCSDIPGHLGGLIADRRHDVVLIPQPATAMDDARLTREALRARDRFDWLVVDHYGLDAAFEAALRPEVERIFVIDDLADRPHDADVLLDCSRPAADGSAYDGLVDDRTRRLVGPDYVALRDEFRSMARPVREAGEVRRVLVTLGGNDPLDTTSLVLDAIDRPAFRNIAFDVTLGSANPRLQRLADRMAGMPAVTAHVQHPRPSELMVKADLCIGAGGQTSWERCFLGVPTLLIVLADNQATFSRFLVDLGVCRLVGDGRTITADDLARELDAAISDRAWREAAARAGRRAIDGRGLDRILDVLASPE